MKFCITTCIRSCGCGCNCAQQQSQRQEQLPRQQSENSGSRQAGSMQQQSDDGCSCEDCRRYYEQQRQGGDSRQMRGGDGGNDSGAERSEREDDRQNNSRAYPVRNIDNVDRPRSIDKDSIRASAENLKGYQPNWGPSYSGGRVRALLIGINYYGSKSELSGCVNDVRHEITALKKIKFPAEEVAILVDDDSFPNVTARPTRDNMLKYMAWLVDDAQEGDVLFMHYSGHGAQIRSKNDDEEEKDQVICPVDYESAGVIVDDDLYDILAADLPAGVRLTVVLDCCNSGSALDLPYAFVLSSDNSESEYHMKQVRRDNRSRGDVIMFSGANDTQTSASVKNSSKVADTGSDGNNTGGPGGAATQCFTYILDNMDELSYKDAVLRARELLARQNLKQSPQLTSSVPIDLNTQFSLTERLHIDKSMRRTMSRRK